MRANNGVQFWETWKCHWVSLGWTVDDKGLQFSMDRSTYGKMQWSPVPSGSHFPSCFGESDGGPLCCHVMCKVVYELEKSRIGECYFLLRYNCHLRTALPAWHHRLLPEKSVSFRICSVCLKGIVQSWRLSWYLHFFFYCLNVLYT